jgi:RNA polymerase sigma-70 factor (ECF subfamily)
LGNEELQLIDRCLAGEQAAMTEFVERFRTPVFGLAYRMLGHRHDAEDVSQESFVRALRSLHQWDRSRAMLPWLLAIVGNRCRTLLASRRKRPTAGLAADQLADSRIEPQTQNLAEEVSLGLAGLRVEYRQAFLLFHEQQLSYQEIAESMGKPVGTIKTWVHRGRRELVERLKARGVVEVS